MHNINAMVIFAKVVQAGGFTAAANALGLPKSNISRHVSRLENELNVRLLERSTRRIRLTEIGEIYYRHCQRVIEEVEQAELSVNQMLEGPRGVLRVSASVTSGQQLLSPILSGFLLKYPDVQLQLELSNRRIDLIEEGFDLAIRIGPLADSRLVSRYLGKSRLYLYASKQYTERMGEPVVPHELTDHQLLLMDEMGLDDTLLLLGPRGEEKLIVKPYCTVNDFHTLHQLTSDGVGITVLPHYMCNEDIKKRGLLRVLPDWEVPPVDFHALYPSHRGATPKLRTFLDFIVEKLSRRLNK